MTCSQASSIFHSPNFLLYSLHFSGFLSIPIHLFGAYCILFKTPVRMNSVKWSLFQLHMLTFLVDFAISVLTVPLILMPLLAGNTLGVLNKVGIPLEDQAYCTVVVVAVMGVSIVGVFENRYLVLSPYHGLWRRVRIFWFLTDYFIAFAFFLPTYLTVPEDQNAEKVYILQNLPCLPEEIVNMPLLLVTRTPLLQNIITTSAISFFTFQAVFFCRKTAETLKDYDRKLSRHNLDLQKTLVKALLLQLSLPLIILIIPLSYCGLTILFWYHNQALNNFSFIFISFHGFFSSITMLYIHIPYRNEILSPKWADMEIIFVATTWILITCVCKTVFTKLKQNQWINIIPESALQIFLGLVLAGIFYGIDLNKKFYEFDAHVFFAFLLPPIIFDAGFFMPNREFFQNFDAIMLFAVVGTVFNTFAIGFCLKFLNDFGIFSMEMSTSEVLLFASLISAVDPVAVIAVFEEMHVKKSLFVSVFGEALFNDAISVVLFGIFKSFTQTSSEASKMSPIDYFLAFLAFFIVSFGGVIIGVLSAFGCAIGTKFTENVPVIGSLLVFVTAYLGYVISEIFSFSSIIAAAVCGMMVKQYLEKNLTKSSLETVSSVTRNLAISSESLTFILLGLATISTDQHWDTCFVAITIFLCIFFRFVAIFGLAMVLRITRNRKIPMNELLLISFGGLRGAIAFGVVLSMPSYITAKPLFITATLSVIFFSVIVQGMLIRPAIRILKNETLNGRNAENLEIQGSEETAVFQEMNVEEPDSEENGKFGFEFFKKNFDNLNEKFLMPILTRN